MVNDPKLEELLKLQKTVTEDLMIDKREQKLHALAVQIARVRLQEEQKKGG